VLKKDANLVEALLALGADQNISGYRGTVRELAIAGEDSTIVAILDRMCLCRIGFYFCVYFIFLFFFFFFFFLTWRYLCCVGYKEQSEVFSSLERVLSFEHGNMRDTIALAKEHKRLNLTGMGLSSLPSEIFELEELLELNLSDNQLASIPSEISKLTSLTSLKLDSNRLTTLPQELGFMTNLKELTVTLNPGLAPVLKRKSRIGLSSLQSHLRKYGMGGPGIVFIFILFLFVLIVDL
jgi:hypothetical protein